MKKIRLKKIYNICSQYNLDKNNKIIQINIDRILDAEEDNINNFKRNIELFKDKNVISSTNFPSARMTIISLIGLFKTKRTNQEMPSGQIAKQAQTLRECGFEFRQQGKNYTFHLNNIEYREIIGFNPKKIVKSSLYNKLSINTKKIIKSNYKEDFLGNPIKNYQIDHRIPQSVIKKENLPPRELNDNLIKNGNFDEHFQILDEKTNYIKREVCKSCQNGEEIYLPPNIAISASNYRKFYNEDKEKCIGCFWHNYLNPKNKDNFPDLISEKEKNKNKIQKIIEKMKEIK